METPVRMDSSIVATALRHGRRHRRGHSLDRPLHRRPVPRQTEEGRPQPRQRFSHRQPPGPSHLRPQRQIRERSARRVRNPDAPAARCRAFPHSGARAAAKLPAAFRESAGEIADLAASRSQRGALRHNAGVPNQYQLGRKFRRHHARRCHQESSMNCAVHTNVEATGFCRNCGKALCPGCTREVRGALYCEQCLAGLLSAPPATEPGKAAANPGLAATLGIALGCFYFYMPIEAYRTARARRDGQAEPANLIDGGADRKPIGAFILIGIGALLLLGNFGLLQQEWLRKSWPVALILIGGWILWDRLHPKS